MRIVCIGLDGAGKTTIINKVRGVDSIAQPTTGFNVESVSTSKKWEFSVIDVSGAATTRALWRHQYHDVAAVVYVVDSADKVATFGWLASCARSTAFLQARLGEASKELESAMKDNELRGGWLLTCCVAPLTPVQGCLCYCLPTSRTWTAQPPKMS